MSSTVSTIAFVFRDNQSHGADGRIDARDVTHNAPPPPRSFTLLPVCLKFQTNLTSFCCTVAIFGGVVSETYNKPTIISLYVHDSRRVMSNDLKLKRYKLTRAVGLWSRSVMLGSA